MIKKAQIETNKQTNPLLSYGTQIRMRNSCVRIKESNIMCGLYSTFPIQTFHLPCFVSSRTFLIKFLTSFSRSFCVSLSVCSCAAHATIQNQKPYTYLFPVTWFSAITCTYCVNMYKRAQMVCQQRHQPKKRAVYIFHIVTMQRQ